MSSASLNTLFVCRMQWTAIVISVYSDILTTAPIWYFVPKLAKEAIFFMKRCVHLMVHMSFQLYQAKSCTNWKQLCSSSFQDFIVALLLLSLCGKVHDINRTGLQASVYSLSYPKTPLSLQLYLHILCAVLYQLQLLTLITLFTDWLLLSNP